MREIPKKNYYILAVIVIITVLATLFIAYEYKNKTRQISDFYKYSNNITSSEFDEYLLENTELIIYISDKYNLDNVDFENKFQNKIDKLNLKNKLVYINSSELSDKFLKKLDKDYKIRIDKAKLPVVITIVDKNVINVSYIDNSSNVDEIISYEVFE